ncbi:MAG: type II secretion system protein GspL [Gammaproteobacteria bacterium]|nr:type II secretion system protein GspL [Gammaproteobacteria bacterium]MDH5239857.1 type II secretion system protein GspL [Gammaproteobacteria bacterium]MDH5260765.1 type II secretion system protein GspL [Gammaproteobacteria bacterium]MDH5584780.1 type II secretion system protein GspL [Gammaproteobacteria bacterium]
MKEYLVIRLAGEHQPVEWLLADGDGTRRSGVSTGSLEQAAAASGDRDVIALVPSEELLSTTAEIPVRSHAKIRAALPYALEENLAEDVERLHFAAGVRQENNRLPVVVVSHAKMSAWLGQLHEAGIQPTKLFAENHGLPKIPGTLSILVDNDILMFNDGANAEFVMQGLKPSDLLAIAGLIGDTRKDGAEKPKHLLAFCTAEQNEQLSHDWIALRSELDSVDVNVLPDGVLPKLAVTVAAGYGVNLLQGSYGKRTEYAALFKPWKMAAALLLALGVIAMTMKGVDYYRLSQDESALRAQFTEVYRQIRPDDTREVADPQAMVDSLRRSLGGSAATDVFLPGLRELGVALAANSAAKVEAISYRAGVIDLRLTAPDVPTLDNIQKAVSASGRFQASIQSTDQVADQINGRIQIRESGS